MVARMGLLGVWTTHSTAPASDTGQWNGSFEKVSRLNPTRCGSPPAGITGTIVRRGVRDSMDGRSMRIRGEMAIFSARCSRVFARLQRRRTTLLLPENHSKGVMRSF